MKNEWQSGIMYMDRMTGTACLKAWEAAIESGKYHFDQDAYDNVPECKARCAIGVVDNVVYMRDFKEIWFSFLSIFLQAALPESRAPFLHYTGASHRDVLPCDQYGKYSYQCLLYYMIPHAYAASYMSQRQCIRDDATLINKKDNLMQMKSMFAQNNHSIFGLSGSSTSWSSIISRC